MHVTAKYRKHVIVKYRYQGLADQNSDQSDSDMGPPDFNNSSCSSSNTCASYEEPIIRHEDIIWQIQLWICQLWPPTGTCFIQKIYAPGIYFLNETSACVTASICVEKNYNSIWELDCANFATPKWMTYATNFIIRICSFLNNKRKILSILLPDACRYS